MKYRPEIDGLRALAVVPVILFHAGSELFSGGYVGVDVFFVISGYLITSILITEIDAGRFSIRRFYERRARRILPALFLVLSTCLPLAWLWMPPTPMADFGSVLTAVALFYSNFHFAQEVEYFALAAETRPLLHTWSLAVEEQYYVVFPLLLFGLWRFGRNAALWAVASIAFVSFAYAVFWNPGEAAEKFFSTPARIWELLAGSLCAFVLSRRTLNPNDILALFGLSMLFYAVFEFDSATPFPSAWTLLPVAGTALLILFGDGTKLVARILTLRPFVFIGLISYSAYLWHQPLFAFARLRNFEEPGPELMTVLTLATFMLAYVSWRFVEQPFRRGGLRVATSAPLLLAFSVGGIVLLGGAGLVASRTEGLPKRYTAINLMDYIYNNKHLQSATWQPLRELTGEKRYGVEGNEADNTAWLSIKSGKDGVLIVGDSHSKDLFNVLSSSSTATERFSIGRFGVQIRDLDSDHQLFKSPNYLAANIIILSAAYNSDDITHLPEVISRIEDDDKEPVIVTRSPSFLGSRAITLVDHMVLRQNVGVAHLQSRDFFDEINAAHYEAWRNNADLHAMNRAIRDIGERFSVPLLDRAELICPNFERRCFAISGQINKHFYDMHHLTMAGAKFLGERIDKIGWLSPLLEQEAGIQF